MNGEQITRIGPRMREALEYIANHPGCSAVNELPSIPETDAAALGDSPGGLLRRGREMSMTRWKIYQLSLFDENETGNR